jgi:hypothetical protein
MKKCRSCKGCLWVTERLDGCSLGFEVLRGETINHPNIPAFECHKMTTYREHSAALMRDDARSLKRDADIQNIQRRVSNG